LAKKIVGYEHNFAVSGDNRRKGQQYWFYSGLPLDDRLHLDDLRGVALLSDYSTEPGLLEPPDSYSTPARCFSGLRKLERD
jgi:hypothetical protein